MLGNNQTDLSRRTVKCPARFSGITSTPDGVVFAVPPSTVGSAQAYQQDRAEVSFLGGKEIQ